MSSEYEKYIAKEVMRKLENKPTLQEMVIDMISNAAVSYADISELLEQFKSDDNSRGKQEV